VPDSTIYIEPLTHAPEIGTRPKFDVRFRRQFFVPTHDFSRRR